MKNSTAATTLVVVMFLALRAAATHPPLSPPDPALFEQVLVPIFTGRATPGANGSVWAETLLVHNGGEEFVQLIAPFSCETPPGCIGPTVTPHTTVRAIRNLTYNPGRPALVIYVPRVATEHLSFTERVHDLSRSANSFGTDIPVVRERDLWSGRIQLLSVPLGDSAFRTMLRVYVPYRDGYDQDSKPVTFVIRAYRMSDLGADDLVAQTALEVHASHYDSYSSAAYAQHGALALDMGLPRGLDLYRLEVEPSEATPSLQFWAFASVTNNDTQHVTVVVPR